MLLVVDIGNTNITLGVYENENLIKTFRLLSDKQLTRNEYKVQLRNFLQNFSITGCIIASVVDELSVVLKSAVDTLFNIESMIFSENLNTGVKINLKSPQEVGADRVANAYGAYVLYGKSSIVVDLGTATTFDIVNKTSDFIGGVIMPGLSMQLKSLSSNTSKLPNIEIKDVEKAIGDNTENAILSGVIRGSACAIDGLIQQAEKELGEKAIIVLTGGYSEFISKYMSCKIDYVNPNLTLEGLRLIYELNN